MLSCKPCSRLTDQVLLLTLTDAVVRDRTATSELLALIAEVDKRALFRGEGYPSMYRYCVEKLRMSEDVAYKRIQTARAARRFPVILDAIADGRLHLSAVVLLKRHLTHENAEALLKAAAGKTKAQVESLIAERFPSADVPTSIQPIGPAPLPNPMALSQGEPLATSNAAALAAPASTASVVDEMQRKLVPEPVAHERTAPNSTFIQSPELQQRIAPLSPGRFELRLTMSQGLHDKLRYAQELLGHAMPSGEIAQILERALDELIAKQERLKFAATNQPRAARKSSKDSRHVPAHMKRAVWNRDKGRCTYVSPDGHRCGARKFLEYDHEQPVARGGRTCVANLRLRCRAHNQMEAERMFGGGFMEEKRSRSLH